MMKKETFIAILRTANTCLISVLRKFEFFRISLRLLSENGYLFRMNFIKNYANGSGILMQMIFFEVFMFILIFIVEVYHIKLVEFRFRRISLDRDKVIRNYEW